MWVKVIETNKLAFLLGAQGFYWNQHRFESMKAKTPVTHVRVRTPSGEVKTLCLSDLAFHSEAIFTERRY